MRTITPLSKLAVKLLPACVLAVMSLPAHSVFIDQPNVKNGIRFYVGAGLSPSLSTTSRKFTYTYGDTSVYQGTEAQKLQQLLADQDKELTDDELRLGGVNSSYLELYAQQAINKDLRIGGSVLLDGGPNGFSNYGAYWGLSADYNKVGRLTVGGRNNGLRVGKTGLAMVNTLNDSGLNAVVSYTGIPDLSINAYHMFAQSADVRNRNEQGWHRSNGLSVGYSFNPAAQQQVSLSVGASRSRGHDVPGVWFQQAKADAYMVGVSYKYNKAKIALDYGLRDEKYSGRFGLEGIDVKTYGAKLDYQVTPRLSASLSYGHRGSQNTNPVSFAHWTGLGLGASSNDTVERLLFNEVKQDRYALGVNYQLFSNVSLNGSVASLQTKNYVTEGQFSKREELTSSVGASFSF